MVEFSPADAGTAANRCQVCGKEIPEGKKVCLDCMLGAENLEEIEPGEAPAPGTPPDAEVAEESSVKRAIRHHKIKYADDEYAEKFYATRDQVGGGTDASYGAGLTRGWVFVIVAVLALMLVFWMIKSPWFSALFQ